MKAFYERIILAAALAALPCATHAQTLVSERSISTNAALEMATAALDACRKHGSVVTITILDRADRVVVSVRDDGASPHSVEHSLRKAHTALTYDMSSAEFGKNAAKNPGSAGPLHLANITTAAGGLPIHGGNTLVGAIGVSGTPGSKGGGTQDAACGQAGIDRIAKGLTGN
jgi:uncharacterized protein GlcG (DUF336 family)